MSSIFAAIHERWGDSGDITAIIPAEQFTTGWRQDGADHVPLAWLAQEVQRKEWTNSRPTVVTSFQIQAIVRNHAEGCTLQAAVEAAYDNTDWEAGPLKVIKSRIENSYCLQDPDDDTLWQFVFQIETEHWEA